jgi:hypothetical protein
MALWGVSWALDIAAIWGSSWLISRIRIALQSRGLLFEFLRNLQ